MLRMLSRRSVGIALLAIALAIVIVLTFGERPQTAQERPTRTLSARFNDFATPDEITNDIRDRSRELVRVEFRSIADRENVTKFGRVVEDFGNSVVLSKKRTTDMTRSSLDVQRVDSTINLPGAKFDPIATARPETVRPGGEVRSGSGYYILQFGGIATDEWLDSVRDAGVEIVQYAPHNAFFVYGDGAAIAKVAGHSRVRWAGEFRGEHKLTPEMKDLAAKAGDKTALFDVAVFSRADLADVGVRIPGRAVSFSRLPNNFFNVIRVELSPSQLSAVAEIPDVVRIDPYVQPDAEDERSSQIIAGNFSGPTTLNGPGYNPLTQFGVDGTGVTVMVSDDGISIPGNGGFYLRLQTPSTVLFVVARSERQAGTVT